MREPSQNEDVRYSSAAFLVLEHVLTALAAPSRPFPDASRPFLDTPSRPDKEDVMEDAMGDVKWDDCLATLLSVVEPGEARGRASHTVAALRCLARLVQALRAEGKGAEGKGAEGKGAEGGGAGGGRGVGWARGSEWRK
ncbi:hypothetical protein T484DRAFT_1844966 [Baffinella frigidus]|nr:hypothetical protein T484DRAFT_1844966 [Cryptophyta sp. CCMP2293]